MDSLEPQLSFEEALTFLKDILKLENIDGNIKDQSKDDRFTLLCKVIKAFHIRLPFQNVSMLSLEASQRRAPTWSDIKADMMAGVGGLCLTLNAFMYALLTSLRYDVYLTIGSVGEDGPNSHALVILRNALKEGDIHIIEVGFGSPTFHPIPLNMEKDETDEYTFSFTTLKYIKKGIRLVRQHKTSDSNDNVFKTENGWSYVYYFDLVPYRFADFYDPEMSNMETLYRDPSFPAPFLKTIRIIQWREDGIAKAIKNLSFLDEKNGKFQETIIEKASLAQTIVDNFPQLNYDIVQRAILTWQQNTE